MNAQYGQSEQWARIVDTCITTQATEDLTGFKSGAVNFKLGLWDPRTNGVRFLKTLIYNLASGLNQDNWARLGRIRHRDAGDPIAVRYGDELVCLDYLQAVLELEFITRHVDLESARILEIGAGFGRTCHTVLSNHTVGEYCIVDLPNPLALAQRYLRTVLDEQQFGLIRFVGVDAIDAGLAGAFDLCLNIDSFAEMDAHAVHAYLALVDRQCRWLYVKNPVGKYLDRTLDEHAQGSDAVATALRTGVLLDVLDVHDSAAVASQARKFLAAYRPGPGWTCVADGWAPPWSYYWQALYRDGTG